MSIKLGSSLLAGNLDKNMYPSKDEMNELFSSSVKLDGDQEIDGVKTFNDNLYAPNQLDYTNITNCLTHIPQDIKLELVDGTLTLKAGSKVYYTDGSSQVITKDISRNVGNGLSVYVYTKNGNFRDMPTTNCFSGNTQPTNFGNYCIWYDTNSNVLKYTSNAFTSYEECSFPVCLCPTENSVPTSIDQVFNGFGYICSTVFALPGVQGLIPDGRNADGSLKNIEFVTSKVSTIQVLDGTISFGIKLDGETGDYVVGIYGEDVYDDESNIMSYQGVVYSWMYSGNLVFSNNSITSFKPKTTFQAVDYNDLKQVELPTGSVIAFAGDRVPSGYLICNGATVSRTTYDNLFEVIGTTYGVGDGSTTFNLPQLSDGRFIRGESTAGNVHVAGLPNITGTSNWQGVSPNGSASGAFGRSTTSGGETFGGSGSKNIIIFDFNASRSSGVYGRSTTVMPQSLSMRYYIKY